MNLLFILFFLVQTAIAKEGDSSKAGVSDSKVASSEKSEISEKNQKSIVPFQYIAGGIASIFPGFGMGHALQYRYEERGWIHSLLQGLTVAGIASIPFIIEGDEDSSYLSSWSEKQLDWQRNFLLVLGALKIVEAVDAFWLPFHYKIQREYIGPPVSISKKRYVAGGFLSAFSPIGGVGHAVQERWRDRGIFFTVMLVFALPLSAFSYNISGGFLPWTPYFVFKAWEILDVLRLPSHYRITKNPLQASPVFTYHNSRNYDLGLSLRYSF